MPKRFIKHENFVHQPLDNQRIQDVPGVGPVGAERLQEQNILKPEQLKEKFQEAGNPSAFVKELKGFGIGNVMAQRQAQGIISQARRFPE